MSTMELHIVTPERLVYSGQVNMVITRAAFGDIGILPHHAPLISTMSTTRVRIKTEGKEEEIVISEGFLEVTPQRVTILAETAERFEEIDIKRAQAAKERAQKRIQDGDGDLARAELALKRAINRIGESGGVSL